jgi:hypothetical protein
MPGDEDLLQEAIAATDQELFEAAVADELPKEVEIVEDKPEEQPRNPDGTFKAADQEKPESEQPEKPAEQDDRDGQIPAWRLREEAEAKRAALKELEAEKAERSRLANEFANMQRQFAELRKPEVKPEMKPDPLLDPEGFSNYMERKFEERILGERREMSLRMAHRTHGDAFTEAYAAAVDAMRSGDHVLGMRMTSSNDPGETLIAWHREQKTMREVGNDPNAWLEKKLEERLADPTFLAKAVEKARTGASQTNGTRPAVRLPPSLANAARADAHDSNADLDDSSEGLFRFAMK